MIGAKFSRKAFFQSGLGPPQHRTASWINLHLPSFQLLRPRFATSHQFIPRILDNPCSKLRTQFFLRCRQLWWREPAPVLFMISHHFTLRHKIAACPGWEASFRATCPAQPYTAANALCHKDGRFSLHLTHAQSVSLCETSPPTERLGISALPACNEATCFPGMIWAAELYTFWSEKILSKNYHLKFLLKKKHLKTHVCARCWKYVSCI